MNTFNKLDVLLEHADPDSQDWADGGGHETAREYLSQLSPEDWALLLQSWQSRPKSWQLCLTAILSPEGKAAELLLQVADSSDSDVALEAISQIAFYCGIRDSKGGVAFDEKACIQPFLRRTRADGSLSRRLIEMAQSYRGGYGGYVRRLSELLTSHQDRRAD